MSRRVLVNIYKHGVRRMILSRSETNRIVRILLARVLKRQSRLICIDINFLSRNSMTVFKKRALGQNEPSNAIAIRERLHMHLSRLYIGSVYMCPAILVKECIVFGNTSKGHCVQMLVHSVLHLLDLTHDNP